MCCPSRYYCSTPCVQSWRAVWRSLLCHHLYAKHLLWWLLRSLLLVIPGFQCLSKSFRLPSDDGEIISPTLSLIVNTTQKNHKKIFNKKTFWKYKSCVHSRTHRRHTEFFTNSKMCCNPGGCCNLPTCIQCTNFCFNCWTGTAAVPCCRTSCIPGCSGSPGCCCGPRC